MPLQRSFKLALQSLWGNKLRTILTLIGVVMGVASIIMVITLVNGANRYVHTKLSGYGADVFQVTRMPSVIFNAQDYFRFQKRKIVRIEDYDAVRDGCTDCSEVGAALSKSTNVFYNGHSSNNTEVRGYTWTMLGLNNIDIAMGRGFTPSDEEHGTHGAIVGYKTLWLQHSGRGRPHRQRDSRGRESLYDRGRGRAPGAALWASRRTIGSPCPSAPISRIHGYNDSVGIFARVAGGADAMERAEDPVRVLVWTRRHDAPGSPDDFEVQTNDTFLDIWKPDQFALRQRSAGTGIDLAGGGRRGDHEHPAW